MFCQNCGKELEDNWTVCPNCGNRIPVKNETEEKIKEDKEDTFEEEKLLIAMFREHPVRASLCIPVLLYILYLVYQLISKNMHELNLWFFIDAGAKMTFCETGIWLLYGPVNLKEVKEKVRKKPEKGYRILSHVGSVILALVILTVGGYMREEPAAEETAPGISAVTEEAGNEPAGDGTDGNMTLEEYLGKCQEVTGEDLVRNPEQYTGKDIKIEGSFNILADSLIMNWFTDSGIIKINYDGKAIDTQGNVVGNVMAGDYGLAAGRYGTDSITGYPCIDAAAIIIDREKSRSGSGENAEATGEAESGAGEDIQETMEMEYIFPDSDSRYLSEDELLDLDSDVLKLARNEIFARHGYIFKDKKLQEYFKSTSWYKGTVKGKDFDMEKEFNDFEKANVALIGSFEEN